MSDDRTKAYDTTWLSALFNMLNGYYDLRSKPWVKVLEEWGLLEDRNRKESSVVASYVKWSFAVSFLQVINAWQWFLAGILLGRQSYMPAQIMQLYYYAIFFSYGAFLSAQLKGHHTVKIEVVDDKYVKKTRREVWVSERDRRLEISVKQKGGGGEHEIRANWFYEVFKNWDMKQEHPEVLAFRDDRKFHVDSRNMYTYSIDGIGEELFYGEPNGCPVQPSIDDLIALWERDAECAECFPEEFWAMEHIRVPLSLHIKLLEKYDKASPYAGFQIRSIRSLYEHHRKTGLAILLKEAMEPIFDQVGIH